METYFDAPTAPIVEQWQQTGTSLQSGEGSCMWTGTIDVSTGSFSQAHPPLYVVGFGECSTFSPCGSMGSTRQGTVDMTTHTFSASGTDCSTLTTFCTCRPFTQVGTLCGGGAVDSGEACDDGNAADGDGCSTSCTVEPCFTCSGDPSVCTPVGCDDGFACTEDSCDPGSGTCLHQVPTQTCRSAKRSTLAVRGNDDRISWKWRRGDATTLAELADPTSTASYFLCLDAGTGLIAEATILAGHGWKALRRGYRFKDATRSNNGVEKMVLKAGAAGRTAIALRTRGTTLPAGAPPLSSPVRMRVENESTGICWATTYAVADVTRNDADRFKARRIVP